MIISADTLPGGANLAAHLAVVGAGPVGVVIALEAAKKGFDVLLIESGYSKFRSEVQELAEAAEWDEAVHAPMSMAVRRQLGGTSTVWGGRCVPYDPVDFDQRKHITDIDWPVAYDDLRPYFQRACDWLQCGRAIFDAAQISRLPSTMVPGLANEDVSTASLERWSSSTDFAREYMEPLVRSNRVRILEGLTCTGVISGSRARLAERLVCRTLAGKQVSIEARSYVLACGGLETTRLLLSSRGPNGGALGDHSGNLGDWYMGHVGGVIANVRFLTAPRATVYGYERDVDGTQVRRRFSISREAQLEHELPNVIGFLANPELGNWRHRNGILSLAYLALRSPVGEFIAPAAQRVGVRREGNRQPGGTDHRNSSIRLHAANVVKDSGSVARFAAQFTIRRFHARGRKLPGFFSAYSGENLYPIQYHGEHVPNRDSRIILSDRRDAVGMPRLKIDLRFAQQDVDGILRCHQVWDEYLRRSGCGRLEYVTEDPASTVWSKLGGGTHQLGTTRIGARPEDGVVDENLAVHGIDNVFVASSSVFLTSSQANPTFMTIVFALRLVDRLSSILGSLGPGPGAVDQNA